MNNKSSKSYSIKMRNCARNLRKRSTPQERMLWRYLRNKQLGVKFRRQVSIDDKYIVDFVCFESHLVIEIDGSQHAENKSDKERTNYLEGRGFEVIRFWNNEIDRQLPECLEKIYSKCVIDPSPALRASSPQGAR